MTKKYDPLVDSKQAIRKGGVRKTPFAGVKSHYDVPFSKRGEQLRSHSVNKFLNPRSDKVEYHKQFSARYKVDNIGNGDLNVFASKKPRKDKVLEMLVTSTPMRMLQTRFTQLPAAGTAVDYDNHIMPLDKTFKKHFDV